MISCCESRHCETTKSPNQSATHTMYFWKCLENFLAFFEKGGSFENASTRHPEWATAIEESTIQRKRKFKNELFTFCECSQWRNESVKNPNRHPSLYLIALTQAEISFDKREMSIKWHKEKFEWHWPHTIILTKYPRTFRHRRIWTSP